MLCQCKLVICYKRTTLMHDAEGSEHGRWGAGVGMLTGSLKTTSQLFNF